MRCPEPGNIRAYIDRELDQNESEGVKSHLDSCPACILVEAKLRDTAYAVNNQLNYMAPGAGEAVKSRAEALYIFKHKVTVTESAGERIKRRFVEMISPFSGQRWRFATLTSVLVVGMVLVFFTPVGIAAENLLSVFRAKRFQAVSMGSSNIQNLPAPTDLGVFQGGPTPTTRVVASVSEASPLVGFPVGLPATLPSGFNSTPEIKVTDGTSFKFTFDLPKIEAYLSAAGIRGINLPANLNGATIKAEFPSNVSLTYRDGRRNLIMGMVKSPVLEVPPDLDVDYLRDQLLRFPGLSPETQTQLRAIKDWKNTVVVPVPKSGASHDVSINGAEGVVISGGGQTPVVAILWLKNDIIYGLSGNVSEEELLAAARSIK